MLPYLILCFDVWSLWDEIHYAFSVSVICCLKQRCASQLSNGQNKVNIFKDRRNRRASTHRAACLDICAIRDEMGNDIISSFDRCTEQRRICILIQEKAGTHNVSHHDMSCAIQKDAGTHNVSRLNFCTLCEKIVDNLQVSTLCCTKERCSSFQLR